MISLIAGFFKQNLLKIVVLGALLGGAFFYYSWSQHEIKTLRDNAVILNHAVSVQKETIDNLQKDIALYKKVTKELREKYDQYQKDLDNLREKFNKNNRDFEKLAKEKPELIQRIINEATQKEMDCLEELSRNESGESCQ